MTRQPRPDRRRAAGPPTRRDPYGLLPAGAPVSAILSALGLVVVLLVSMSLLSGQLPVLGGQGGPGGSGGPGASDDPGVIRTPTPPDVVVVPSAAPGREVRGTLVYAKGGNVWLQSGGTATQLTGSGRDSMPAFAEDGTVVYFVRTRDAEGAWSVDGTLRNYRLVIPAIMRIPVTGGEATRVLDGLVDPPGVRRWAAFIRNPVVSPDGRTLAMTSDLPDPSTSDVTLKLLDLRNGRITSPDLDQQPPLGHQDAAWRPDGEAVAYVRNDRDGAKGTPRIYLYTVETGQARAITGPGYLHPAWSPDGRYLAATRTSAFGTDVVLLDAATGSEVARVTADDRSWAPVWSPAGDRVAYLHVSGQVIDLRMATLEGLPGAWTVGESVNLTTNAGLDSLSRPGWSIPRDQLPAQAPATAAPSGS